MNINLFITKDYRKKDDFAVRKNKPNSNPIFEKPKMNASISSKMAYEYKYDWTLSENKTNQTQFLCPQKGKTDVRCQMSEVIYLSSAFCFLSSVHGHQPPPTSYLPPHFLENLPPKMLLLLCEIAMWNKNFFKKLSICTRFYSIIVLFYTLYRKAHLSVE